MANYLNIPSGSSVTTPTQAGFAAGTGTIDIRCEVAPVSWTPAGKFPIFMAQDNRFAFYGYPTGEIEFDMTHLGGSQSFAVSSVSTGLGAGVRKWVRALRNISAGTCNFYTSPDGTTWTALGTQTTGLLTTTENTTGGSTVRVGWDNNAGDEFVGSVFTSQFLVGGSTIANMDWTTATSGSGPWTSGTGETWTATGTASVLVAGGGGGGGGAAAGRMMLTGVGA